MLGAQIKGLQLQTLAPDLFNTWALQMPLGVWICRAQGGLDLPTATVGLGVWTFKESSRDFFSGITKEGFGGNNCNTPFFHGFFPGVFQARKAGDSFKPPKLDLPLKNTLSQCCGSPEF